MEKNNHESVGRIRIKKDESVDNTDSKQKIAEDTFDDLLLKIQDCYKSNKDKT